MLEAKRVSQTGLVVYEQCPHQYYLRYIEGLRWPAPVSEASRRLERAGQLGQRFHRLVEQHALGLDVDRRAYADPDLGRWWDRFRSEPPEVPAGTVYSELTLACRLGDVLLTATFDRIVVHEDGLTIIDWKTSKHRPERDDLEKAWQTIVYLYVLAEAAAQVSDQPWPPEAIELVYWYAEHAGIPQRIPYSSEQHAEAKTRLQSVLAHLAGTAPADYPRTDDLTICAGCLYRTYCQRDEQEAGDLDDALAGLWADDSFNEDAFVR